MSATKSLNVWDYKPRWCQPWSILLTGISAIAGCWFLTKNFPITLGLAFLVAIWWVYFLIVYPRLFKKMTSESENLST
jgi:hypothetical protein